MMKLFEFHFSHWISDNNLHDDIALIKFDKPLNHTLWGEDQGSKNENDINDNDNNNDNKVMVIHYDRAQGTRSSPSACLQQTSRTRAARPLPTASAGSTRTRAELMGSTVQYDMILYSTVQYYTVQYSTI